jgi:hypothetical protein
VGSPDGLARLPRRLPERLLDSAAAPRLFTQRHGVWPRERCRIAAATRLVAGNAQSAPIEGADWRHPHQPPTPRRFALPEAARQAIAALRDRDAPSAVTASSGA